MSDRNTPHHAVRTPSRRWVAVLVPILLLAVVGGGLWWFLDSRGSDAADRTPTLPTGPTGDEARRTSSSDPTGGATPSDGDGGATPSDEGPTSTGTGSPNRTDLSPSTDPGAVALTEADLDSLLLTASDLKATKVDWEIDTPTDTWKPLVQSATPAGCAVLIDTVPDAPEAFRGLVGRQAVYADETFTQRVYLLPDDERARAVVDAVQATAETCPDFTTTAAAAPHATSTWAWRTLADTDTPAGLRFSQTNSDEEAAMPYSGFVRVSRVGNAVVVVSYQVSGGLRPDEATAQALFDAAEARMVAAGQ